MKLIRQLVTIALVQFSAIVCLMAVTNFVQPTQSLDTKKPLPLIEAATPTPVPLTPPTSLPTKIPPTPTIQPTLASQVQPPPAPDTRCIVVVDGDRYDVTQFRSLHQGGDIFQCGTDMTAIFYSQHNAETKMKFSKYKL